MRIFEAVLRLRTSQYLRPRTRTASVNYFNTYTVHLFSYFADCVWNAMANVRKTDFVFLRNGRVHLNRRGRHFSRLLAAEVCASALVMLIITCSEVAWRVLGYPLYSPVSPFTSPPVRHRVPSHFSWTLQYNITKHVTHTHTLRLSTYRPAKWQNQHTDCIYSHHKDGLHYNKKMILTHFIIYIYTRQF